MNTEERVGRIDENLDLLRKDLLGNGQPGRIPLLEKTVNWHSKIIWMGLGALWLIEFVLHGLSALRGK